MPKKKKSAPSLSSTVVRARISNEAYDVYAQGYKKNGHDSMGAFVREVLEKAAKQEGITLYLSPTAMLELEFRAKKRNYKTTALYLAKLLEAYVEEPGISERHEPKK